MYRYNFIHSIKTVDPVFAGVFSTIKLFIIIIFLISLFSCRSEKQLEETPNSAPSVKNEISLSQNQEELAGIETGKIQKHTISEIVECSGNIEVPPQSLASVNAPMGGFVEEAKFYVGNFVTKGTILATLQHTSYIVLQQKYLEAKSMLEYNQEEFKRQSELTLEDAASMKKMQKAKADFNTTEATLLSLEAQLMMIGINPDDIKKKGIQSTIKIKAPISGYISKINTNIGKFMNDNEPLYEIVNKEHLHLHLKVFENDVPKIKTGQQIHFTLPGNTNKIYNAIVNTIGQNVDERERTVNIHAHLSENNSVFKPGMFVNAHIRLSGDSVYALPSTAIINEEAQTFIFAKNTNGYRKIPIQKGIEQNKLVQVINPDKNLLNLNIVTKGAYYLNAEMTEEE